MGVLPPSGRIEPRCCKRPNGAANRNGTRSLVGRSRRYATLPIQCSQDALDVGCVAKLPGEYTAGRVLGAFPEGALGLGLFCLLPLKSDFRNADDFRGPL